MHDDLFPAAEKILSDIETIFRKDKNLTNFEILPVPVGENKSPVVHAEHSLGLEKWCVQHLYLHLYHKIIMLKQQQRLRREDPNIVSRLLLGGVLLNPDNSFLWNIRRDFVVIGRHDCMTELHISAVTLSRRPKCSEAFTYRRWILNRMLAKFSQPDASFLTNLLTVEMKVTQMAADRYANNYHAWNHRMWAVSKISHHLPTLAAFLVEEWTTSESWVSSHVSEHSGLQYRQFLFEKLTKHLGHSAICFKLHEVCSNFFHPKQMSESISFLSKPVLRENSMSGSLQFHFLEVFEKKQCASKCPLQCEKSHHVLLTALLVYDLMLVTELICLYPGHEALWSHRRFIMFSLCTLAKQLSSETCEMNDGIPVPKAQKLSMTEGHFEEDFLWKVVLWHDEELFTVCTNNVEEDCYQKKLAVQFRKWLQQVLLPRV